MILTRPERIETFTACSWWDNWTVRSLAAQACCRTGDIFEVAGERKLRDRVQRLADVGMPHA